MPAPGRYKEWAASDQAKGLRAVSLAVRRGEIPPIKNRWCFDCMRRARVYHHHRGYAPAHLLDVIPLCYDCHSIRHRKEGTYRGNTAGKERTITRQALRGASIRALALKYKATQSVIREIILNHGQEKLAWNMTTRVLRGSRR